MSISSCAEPRSRRQLLGEGARVATLLAAAGLLPGLARAQGSAWNAAAFETHTIAELMKALAMPLPAESKEVTLQAPDIAENGAAVQLLVSSTLPNVRRLLVLIEKNPNLLAALFEFGDVVEPVLTTRVKMAESSNVYALAQLADGRTVFTRREVKVTLGGCGA